MNTSLRGLIVEDSRLIQKAYGLALEDLGYDVEVVETGLQALILLKANHYDIVLMDVGLPDMKGYEVAKSFRQSCEKNESTPILVTSAHLNSEIRNYCLDAGCNLVLDKSITLKELKEHVGTLVARRME